MGKTGTTKWIQVKGVKGQIRLVPQKEAGYKKPGPNQRFKSGSTLKRVMKSQDDRRGGRGGARGGRGGRGRGGAALCDPRARRRIRRSTASVKGSK
jgi:hypothetical protein